MRQRRAACWVLGAVVAIATLATPAPAWAHAELLTTDPAYGDRRPVAPHEVRFEFSEPISTTGARLELRQLGATTQTLREPSFGSPDRRVVLASLPAGLPAGRYAMAWSFLGNDGHLMAGEVAFSVGPPSTPAAPPVTAPAVTPNPAVPPAGVRSLGPGIAGPGLVVGNDEAPPPAGNRPPGPSRFRMSVAAPQAVVRLIDYASLVVLIGGGLFLALVWPDGAGLRRTQRLLWAALGGSALAAFLTYGLTAAGLRGLSALDALRPAVLGEVAGTRLARVITVRAGFLALAAAVLATLALGRERSVRSRWWQGLAALSGGGILATRTLLGHVSGEGLLARVAVFVHLAGVALWLGGLIMIVAVVLPRGGTTAVRTVLPRFSRVAFAAVCVMIVAGALTLNRVVPSLGQLPSTGYGRVLLLKLAFVVALLVAAQQARAFTERRLVLSQPAGDTTNEPTRLRPLFVSVGVELSLAVAILAATTVLAGRPPPTAQPKGAATASVTTTNEPPASKGR